MMMLKFKHTKLNLLASIFLLLLFSENVFGQATITSAQSGNWNSAATWVGGVVPNSTNHDNVIIAAGHAITSTVGNPSAYFGLITIEGTLIHNGALYCNSISGNGNIYSTLLSPSVSIVYVGYDNSDFTFSGVIGPGNITISKNGTGTFTLSGNNSYTAFTYINSGYLKATSPNALGSTTGTTSVANGGALLIAGDISISEPLKLYGFGPNGAGSLRSVSGSNTITGEITTPGSIIIAADADAQLNITSTFSSGSVGQVNLVSTTPSSFISMSTPFERNYKITFDGAGDGIYSGTISGVSNVSKVGTGTWTLSGNNSYSGTTTVTFGTLKAGIAINAFGINSQVILNNASSASAAILDLNNLNQSVGSIYCNQFGTISLGTANLTFGTNNGNSAAFNGVITGSGNIIKVGTGSANLSNASTFTGTTTISAGTLSISSNAPDGSAGALGASNENIILGDANTTLTNASPSLLFGSNTLNIGRKIVVADFPTAGTYTIGSLGTSGTNTFSGQITLYQPLTILGGTITGTTSPLVFSGGIVNGNSSEKNITVACASSTNLITISGNIDEGSGILNIVSQSSGGLALSGSNSYSGKTSIFSGYLSAQNNNALGSSANGTFVSDGAELRLQGNITIATEPLQISGSGISSGGTLRNISGANSFNGPITLLGSNNRINADAGTLTISSSSINGLGLDLTFGGASTASGVVVNALITIGTGSIYKDGLGTATINQSPALTGNIYVSAGILKAGAVLNFPTRLILNTGKFDCNGFNSTANLLTLGSTLQLANTFGSTISSAIVKSNTYFNSASTGILTISNANCNGGAITAAQSICAGSTPNSFSSSTAGSGVAGSTLSYKWQSSSSGLTNSFSEIASATNVTYAPGSLNSDTWYRRVLISTIGADVCTDYSNAVKISVVPTPSSGQIGSSQNAGEGETVEISNLSEAVGSSGALIGGYQWESNTNLSTPSWAVISGANSNSYSARNLSSTTQYRRSSFSSIAGQTCYSSPSSVVTIALVSPGFLGGEGGGEIMTTASNLPVNNPGVSINSTGIISPYCFSTNAGVSTLSYTATTGTPNTYSIAWTGISNQTSTNNSFQSGAGTIGNVTIPASTSTGNYNGVLTISNSNGCLADLNVSLVVNPSPVISNKSATICSGTAFSISPTDILPDMVPVGTNYVWTVGVNSNVSGQQDVSFSQSSVSQSLSNASSSLQSLDYTITPSTSICTGPTFVATVSVVPIPTAGTIANDHSIFYGQTPNTLTSTLDGVGAAVLSYTWQNKNSSTWSSINGATASTYSPGTLTEITQYRRYSNSTVNSVTCTSLASNVVTVDIKYPQYIGGDGRGDFMNISPEAGKISSDQTICYNSSATISSDFDASPIKDATISYRWESSPSPFTSWTTISGEVSSSLSLTGLTTTKKYRRVTVAVSSTQTVESVPTLPVTITVYPLFVNGSISNDQTICYNTVPATLVGLAPSGSTGAYTYQWEKYNNSNSSWDNIPGETNLNLIFSSGLTSTTKYRLKQLSGSVCGIGYTNEVTINVYDNFNSGAIETLGQSICVGTDPSIISSLTDASGGDNSIYYKWQSKPIGGSYSDIPGETNASYDPPSSVSNTTIYRRLVKDGTCNAFTASSGEWILTVYPILQASVSIVSDATLNTICEGTPVHFTAIPTNGGTSPIYQWKLNGVNVGTNSTVYTSTTLADGDVISVEMTSNAAPCMTGSPAISNSITMTVNLITTITSQPSNAQICYGDAMPLLSVTASVFAPISYQWYTNTSLTITGGTSIAGATSSSYQVPSSISTNPSSNYYYVIVSGACQSAVSNAVSVISYPAFSISLSNSGPINICNNTSTVLGVTAFGSTGSYTYQWYSNSVNSLVGAIAIPGATNSNYTVPGTTIAGDRFYYVKVSSAPCSQLTSNIIKVITSSSLSVNNDPLSQVVCNNVSSNISGSAIGGSNVYSYLWYTNTINSNVGGTAISGANSSSYTVPATQIPGYRYFYLVISDATDVLCGIVRTNVATIETRASLQISSNPITSQTVCNNTSTNLSVTPFGGSGNYNYQWFSNTINSNSGGTLINGANQSTLITSPNSNSGSFFYYAVVTDQNCPGSITSNIGEVITRSPLSVGLQPASLNSICNNSSVSISTGGNGAANAYKYQWYTNSVNSNIGGSIIANAISDSYLVPPTLVNGSRYYYAVITDSICNESIKTNVAEIYTYSALQITHQPADSINICNNSSSTISISISGGSGTYTYQWFQSLTNTNTGGSLLSGQTASTFIVPSTPNAGNYYYYVVISDPLTGNCSIVSAVSIAHVYSPISVLQDPPISISLCNNVGTTISVVGAGTNAQFTYQWYTNNSNSSTGGVIINGATSATYSVPATRISGNRYFYAVIGNTLCSESISTSVSTIITRDSLIIQTQPVSVSATCNNTSSALSVSGSGASGSYSYQWFENIMNTNSGGLAIPGATSATYTAPATLSPGDRYFYVRISDNLCSESLISNTATVSTLSEFRITSQPLNFQFACNNATSILSVEKAGGSNQINYQWYSNGVNSNNGGVAIVGATASTYTVPGTTIQGDRYFYVKIIDANCGTLTSNVAIVSTRSIPEFIIQPAAVSQVCNNANQLIYAIAVGGSGSLTYQWYSNSSNNNTGGTLISGATAASYTVPGTNTSGDRYYYAIVTDASCSNTTTSAVSKVTTRAALSIVSEPVSTQFVCNNSSVQLSVQAGGASGVYAYQWYSNSVNSNTGGTSISGATSSSYSVPRTTSIGVRYYYVIISDLTCSTTINSTVASVTSYSAIQIQAQTATSQTVCSNNSATIGITVSGGNNNLSYQWYSSLTASVIGGVLIPGANQTSYIVPGISTADTRYFYLVVADNTCNSSITSEVFTINTLGALVLNTEPLNAQNICNNVSATLFVEAAGGSGTLNYQWYSNTANNNTGGSIILGANSESYTVPASTIVGDRYYYVAVSDANCMSFITSAVAKVTTRSNVYIVTQPLATQTICNNTSVTLSTAVSGGSGIYTYQWFKSTLSSNTGGIPISGAISADYTVPASSQAGAHYYYIEISDIQCSTNTISQVATIVTRPALQILTQPVSAQIICNNTIASLSVVATGGTGSLTYQWYQNSNNTITGASAIIGATATMLTVPATSISGDRYYFVKITDVGCLATINSAISVISNRDVISISTQPTVSQLVCNNSSALLNIQLFGGSGLQSCQWYSNTVNSNMGGTLIPGATSLSYVVQSNSISGINYYYAIVNDLLCGSSDTSEIAEITIIPSMQIQSQTQINQVICNNTTTTIGMVVSGGSSNISYQWYSNNSSSLIGGVPVNGTILNQYTVPASTVSGNRYFYVIATDNICNTQVVSSVFTISTISSVSISVNPLASQTICNNTDANLSVVASGGTGSLSYQWYSNSVNSTIGATLIAGANLATYTVPASLISGDRYFYVVIIDAGCGTSTTSNISKITTLEAPTMLAVPNRAFCNGELINTIAFSSNYLLAQYSWTNSNTNLGLPSSGVGYISGYTLINSGATAVSGNISVIPHYNGCDGAPFDFVITVNPTPTVSVISDQSICAGSLTQPINFISSLSGSTFQWLNSDPTIGLASSGNGNIASFISTNTTGVISQAQISVKAISSAGCAGPYTLVSTIRVTPGVQDLTIESYPLNVCMGDSVKGLNANIPMGGNGTFNYQWQYSSDNLTYSNVPTTSANTRRLIAPPQNTMKWYRVIASSASCSATSSAVQILVKSKPIIALTHNGLNTISIGNTYSVKANGAVSYLWTPTAFVIDSTAASALLRPIADTRFIVKGTNAEGCSDTASILVNVIYSSLIYPNNILTPNNDGYNDTWKIKNIEFYQENQIKIYNANGILIKEFNNYQGDWDGRVNGNKLPTATYYYMIKLNRDNTIIKGFINIAN